MNLLAQPRPPKWPFLLGDAVLVSAAFLIGYFSPSPLSPAALSAVFGCVALGAVLAVIPFLQDFAATQRLAEAELQMKLEAQNNKLAHTADMLVNAAAALKSAHEAATRAAHTAETLPYRMQEKLAEMTAQLEAAEDEEKAQMEKELEMLREAEGEKLTALADKIRAATKEFTTLEKETRPALEAAVKQTREVDKSVLAATAHARTALGEIEARLQAALAGAETRARETAEVLDRRIADRIAELQRVERDFEAALLRKLESLKVSGENAPRPPRAPKGEKAAPTPKAVDTPAAESAPAVPVAIEPVVAAPPPPAAPVETPAAVAAEPVSTATLPAAPEPAIATSAAVVATAEVEAPATPAPKREPRRKTARVAADSVLPGFAEPEIVYDDGAAPAAGPAKTSNGSTRLLVTAYIGIGNRVFVRGEGPGLSWDKGVPMDFISIGKWSWQTADASAPVTVQLYKNDDLKALGEPITLQPGYHTEASPTFREPDPF